MIKIQPIETESLKLMPYNNMSDGYIAQLHNRWKHRVLDDVEINSLNNFDSRIKQAIETDTVGWICWEKSNAIRIGIVYYSNIIPQIRAIFHPVSDKEGYKAYIRNNGQVHHRIMDEACKESIRYIFKYLNLQRITGAYFIHNKPMIALCKRLGFKEEGIIRKGTRLNNVPCDIILLGLLKEEIK